MNRIHLIKRTFVRQSSNNDCGLACLSMILNYAGKATAAAEVCYNPVSEAGLSLLDLKNLAVSFKLPSRCVKMGIEDLKQLKSPCILHTINESGNNHFQVYYGNKEIRGETYFLIADPAIQVHYISEIELEKQWISHSALYFDELPENLSNFNLSAFRLLINTDAYPIGMWILIPFLSICIASFGITLTWLLQSGINNTQVLKPKVITALIVLLFIISIFKSLFSFLRQYILIKISTKVNNHLMNLFISAISKAKKPAANSKNDIHHGLIDIQKMQNAITTFIGIVLSEGSLVIALLAGLFYELPVAGLISTLFLFAVLLVSLRNLSEISYEQIRLGRLSAETEESIYIDLRSQAEKIASPHQVYNKGLTSHNRNITAAKNLAIRVSRQYLLYECLGTVTVISILTYGMSILQRQAIDYTTFILVVIEAYLICTITPKICSSFQQLADGADAALLLGRK